MVVLKCIFYPVAGLVIAFLATMVVGIPVEIIQEHEVAVKTNGLIFVCFSCLGILIGFVLPIKEEFDKLADAKARKLVEESAVRARNESERSLVVSMASDVDALQETLEPLLNQAAVHITRAELELKDDSVGAFWDEIEAATRRFAQYNNSISVIHKLAKDHAKRRSALPSEFRPNALEPRSLPDGDYLLSRMSKIVKQARRNPQWETIFQQRRTNDILVGGFENLGNALESLQDTVSSGFSDLAHVLHSSVDRITSEHSDRVITELNLMAATHSDDSRERRRFEQNVKANADKAVQVLENIERCKRWRA